ncbi:DUF6055 domain-containing protein [Aliikangiella sp. IMCC44359]|uniref:DUF6055 domain-containing protein n=1 Tax=Aliikangiella sp. IMCC44359 TaxID=3459125 RepID=UPI00403ADA3C
MSYTFKASPKLLLLAYLCLYFSLCTANEFSPPANYSPQKARVMGDVASVLALRNPYGARNVVESEHFAYWYDNEFLGQENLLREELDRMEYSWQVLIENHQFSAPLDQYKLNIYLETAGGHDVPFKGFSGQALVDDDGYPFIMMSREVLNYTGENSLLHSTHEFFHTIQFAYGEMSNYGVYRDRATWFMEASAGWAANIVWGQLELNELFVWSLSQTPDLSLDYDGRKEQSNEDYTPANVHHYSMVFFLDFLAQSTATDIIQKVLENMEMQVAQGEYLNALATIKKIVSDDFGLELADIFTEYAAKNILWDYPEGDLIMQKQTKQDISQISRYLGDHYQVFNHWVYPGESLQPGKPMSWGASYLYFANQELEQVEFSFQSEVDTSYQSEMEWRLVLVLPGSPIQYQSIEVVDNKVESLVINLANNNEFWIAIVPIGPTNHLNQRYDFAYQFAKVGESQAYQPEPLPEVEAYSSGGGGAGSKALLLCLLLILSLFKFRKLYLFVFKI